MAGKQSAAAVLEEMQREGDDPHGTGSKVKTGRPTALSRAEEWELYCYRKSGIALKTCASMWRVSVPTAKRIIAKFRAYDARVEPIAREFRATIESVRDSER
jgi:hypothetical protein